METANREHLCADAATAMTKRAKRRKERDREEKGSNGSCRTREGKEEVRLRDEVWKTGHGTTLGRMGERRGWDHVAAYQRAASKIFNHAGESTVIYPGLVRLVTVSHNKR